LQGREADHALAAQLGRHDGDELVADRGGHVVAVDHLRRDQLPDGRRKRARRDRLADGHLHVAHLIGGKAERRFDGADERLPQRAEGEVFGPGALALAVGQFLALEQQRLDLEIALPAVFEDQRLDCVATNHRPSPSVGCDGTGRARSRSRAPTGR